jgi:hypothetical protein
LDFYRLDLLAESSAVNKQDGESTRRLNTQEEETIPLLLFQHTEKRKSDDLLSQYSKWCDILEQSSSMWTPLQISQAVCGILSAEINPVSLRLARYIGRKALECTANFSQEDVARMIRGFLRTELSDSSPQVLLALAQFCAKKIKESPDTFNSHVLASSLFNLHTMEDTCRATNEIFEALAQRVINHTDRMDGASVALIIYSLNSKSCEGSKGRQLVEFMSGKVSTCTGGFDGQNIGDAMFGLRRMSSKPEVNDLLVALSDKLRSRGVVLDGHIVSNIINGLQCMCNGEIGVGRVLSLLAGKLSLCPHLKLTTGELTMTFQGLQNMNSKDADVRQLLRALTPIIANQHEEISTRAVATVLYGLKGMESRLPEVRSLISVLTPWFPTGSGGLSARRIGSALYGLQGLESIHKEVRTLLSKVIPLVAKSNAKISGPEISRALYGLRFLRSEHAEVRELLVVLTARIRRSGTAELTSEHAGMAIYGLRHMSCMYPEVCEMLKALGAIIEKNTAAFDGGAVAAAMEGIAGKSARTPEVQNLLKVIVSKIPVPPNACFESSRSLCHSLRQLARVRNGHGELYNLTSLLADHVTTGKLEWSNTQIGRSISKVSYMSLEHVEVAKLIKALTLKLHVPVTSQEFCIVAGAMKELDISHKVAIDLVESAVSKLDTSVSCYPREEELANAILGCPYTHASNSLSVSDTSARLMFLKLLTILGSKHIPLSMVTKYKKQVAQTILKMAEKEVESSGSNVFSTLAVLQFGVKGFGWHPNAAFLTSLQDKWRSYYQSYYQVHQEKAAAAVLQSLDYR